jgi:hypothetical protein
VRSQDGGKLSFSVESILAPRKSGDLIEKILIDDEESGQILITLCNSVNQSHFHSPISVAAMKVYTYINMFIDMFNSQNKTSNEKD